MLTKFNPNANSFIPLNPHANIFSPLRDRENLVIEILYFTVFIIVALLVTHIYMMYERGDKDITQKSVLKKMKHSNPNKIIIGHININSIRQKFIFLKNFIGRNINILLTSETKLDSSLPNGQFY